MSSELPLPPRRGRRDNGLDAATYVPLADVDPRIGEHLLDVLKIAGVPAYLEPSADVEPYTRALALPSPPTDRLWVDREQRVMAREIVEAEVGAPRPRVDGDDRPSRGLSDAEEERAWQEIVAGFSQEPDAGPVPPWPVVEDATPVEQDDDDEEEFVPDGASTMAYGRGTEATPADPPDASVDDEGHYVPPPPPPVPRLSKQSLVAVALLALGGTLLVAPRVFGVDDGTGFALGVAAIVCAAGLLVWRLGERRSDDGPDDGAVV